MNELFVKIKGYEDSYEISNLGRVKSISRIIYKTNGRNLKTKEIYLKPEIRNQYLSVTLSKGGKLYKYTIHSLVAKAFVNNPENKPQVNHINGVKTDNRSENLEWVTASENIFHSFRVLGRKMTYRSNPNYIHKGNKKVRCDLLDITFRSTSDAGKFLGISNVAQICRGVRRPMYGIDLRYL